MQNNSINISSFLLNNFGSEKNLFNKSSFILIISFLFFTFTSLFPLYKNLIKGRIRKYLLSNATFIFSLISFLIVGRLPGLIAPKLDPDEAQFIAGAMKLLVNPLFWRSVDTGTSGPLNIFPLAFPAIFGIQLEYASARIVGLFFVIISVVCLYYALLLIYNTSVARLAIFLTAVTFATMHHPQYIHYTSEYFSIALFSICLLVLCFYNSGGNNLKLIFFQGFLLGLVPYAKMQGIPPIFAIFCIFLHLIWQKTKSRKFFINNSCIFILGTISFTMLMILYLTIFSIFDEFWKSYIQQNLLIYSNTVQDSLFKKFISFLRNVIFSVGDTRILFELTGITLVIGIPFLIIKNIFLKYHKKQEPNSFFFVYYSIITLLASLYAVVKPGTGFLHYLLFLIIPSGFLIGVFLGELQKSSGIPEFNLKKIKLSLLTLVIIILVAGSFSQIRTNLKTHGIYFQQANYFYIDVDKLSLTTKSVLNYASPGEYMSVWGWAAELYVDTGMIQATRAANIGPFKSFFSDNSMQEYFFKQYINDLLKYNPKIFVDAVAPKMFIFKDRKTEGHDAFPEIAKVIKEHYKLIDEVKGIRIYLNNSLSQKT